MLDRELLHGDIVAAASDPSGQRGIVVDVDLTVDLLTPTSTTTKMLLGEVLFELGQPSPTQPTPSS